MKTMTRCLIAVTLLTALTSAYAATPTAVWDGFASLTSGSYTWTADSACTISDGVVTIGSAGGMTLTLTSGTIYDGRTVTVLADVEVPAFENESPLIDLYANGSYVTLTSQGTTLRQRWNFAGDSYGSGTIATAVRKRVALVYKGVSKISDRGTKTLVDGTVAVALKNDLMSGSGKMQTIKLGCYAKGTTTKVAEGLKIYRVAIFDMNICDADVAAYKFPSEYGDTVRKGATWGNIGDATNGGIANDINKMSFDVDAKSYTLNFSDSTSICTTGIGTNGYVVITKVRLAARPDDADIPASVTLSQTDGPTNTSYACDASTKVNIYKDDKTLIGERTCAEYTFAPTACFDTSKDITVTYNRASDGEKVGMTAIKPGNVTFAGGTDSWSPAYEFIGDYYFNKGIISVNIAQYWSASGSTTSSPTICGQVSGDQTTLLGTIPEAAWAQACATTIPTVTEGGRRFSFPVNKYVVNSEVVDNPGTTTVTGYYAAGTNLKYDGTEGSYAYTFLTALNMNNGNAKLSVTGIPFEAYDVIIYLKSVTGVSGKRQDKTMAPVKVGETYLYPTAVEGINTQADGETSPYWGDGTSSTWTYGTNVMRVNGLSGDLALAQTVQNYGIAAIQIIESVYEAPSYTATVSGAVKFSEIDTWEPSKPSGGFSADSTLTINNTAAATVTFDEAVTVDTIKFVSESGNVLGLVSNEMVSAKWDFSETEGGLTFASLDGTELAKNAVAGAPYSKWIISGTVTGSPTVTGPTMPTGYSVASEVVDGYGLRLIVTAPGAAKLGSISVNLSGKGYTVSEDATLHGAHPIAGTAWNNFRPNSASTASSIKQVAADGTVTTGSVTFQNHDAHEYDTGKGESLTILRGYHDDGGASQFTFANIPFSQYRVIVYYATDNSDVGFAAAQIGASSSATTYYYGPAHKGDAGETISGTSAVAWGNTNIRSTLVEGHNYIVSDVLTGGGAYVKSTKAAPARATVAAIQIVAVGEVVTSKHYAATVSEAGTKNLSELAWNVTPFAPTEKDTVTITVASAVVDRVTIDVDSEEVVASSFTVVSEGGAEIEFTGNAIMTDKIDVSDVAGKLTVAFATGATPVIAGADTVLASVASPTLTIASGDKLTVKGGTLTASSVSNSGTLNLDGGTAESPIVLNGDTNFGTITLAADTYVKHGETVSFTNRKYLISGQGATSCIALWRDASNGSPGMLEGSSFSNVILISDCNKTTDNIWLENATIAETVGLKMISGICLNGLSPTVRSLTGTGILSRKASETITVKCTEDADFAGECAVPVVIAESSAVQTFSGTMSSTLTVNENAKVRLTGSAMPSSIANSGTVIYDFGVDTTNALTTAKFTNNGTVEVKSGVLLVPDGFSGTVTASDTGVVLPSYTVSVNDLGKFAIPAGKTWDTIVVVNNAGTVLPITSHDDTYVYFDWEITGGACWWDYEFEDNVADAGNSGVTLTFDGSHGHKGAEYKDGALYVSSSPWRNVGTWKDTMTFVMYGKMVAGDKRYQIAFGSKNNNGYQLFIATGSEADGTVNLCLSYAGNEPTVLCTMSVANVQSSDHLYAFVLKTVDGNSVVNTYLDGELLQPYEHTGTITLGGGFQIGSGHGGVVTGYERPESDDPATLDWLRVYDVELSAEAMAAYAVEYPYISPNGTYAREIDGGNWNQANAWSTSGVACVSSPAAGASVQISSDVASSIAVNLDEDVAYESMTVTGSQSLAISRGDGDGRVVVNGRTRVGCDCVFDYNAIRLGGPVTIADDCKLTIDLSNVDLKSFADGDDIVLTGYVSASDVANQVEFSLPESQGARSVETYYDEHTGQFHLLAHAPLITTLLNDYAVREGSAIKVSCNEAAVASEAAKAFDGDASTYYAPGDAANALGVSWTGIEFTNSVIVTRIVFSGNYARRMIGGAFQGANTNDFSDAVNIHVVEEYSGGTADVTLEDAKGPFKYLRFIGMYGGNVKEIKFYGLVENAAGAPTNAPNVTDKWSANGVAGLTIAADADIPQVYRVQRAMANFCESDGSDYETCVTLAGVKGEDLTWNDTEATGYSKYRVQGVNASGTSEWTYFEIEPEKLINGAAAPSFAGDKPGFYANGASVEITYDGGAQIYYTLDGSTPTTNSTKYAGPIALTDVCSKTNELCNIPTNPSQLQSGDAYGWHKPTADQPNVNVIRARAFMSDGSASTNEIAGTWMIGPTVSEALTNGLRVVSVITDKENFFSDPIGIMVPGDLYNKNGYGSGGVGQPNANYFQRGAAWERPAFIEMFDETGAEMFSVKMGTRVHGNWSRASAKKTLVCYSRKELGAKNIKLDKKKFKMFNDEPDHNKFKRLSLRNGGNDWYKLCLRDAVGQSMFRDKDVKIVNTGTQGYEPFVMYVNGEYWGVYNLRHAYCKQHFEEWNGAVEDDIDYIKLSPDDGNHFEVQEGDFNAMWNINQYMVTCTSDDVMEDDEFAEVESKVDIDDMMDFHIINIFLGNNDWMSNGNNMGMWRNRSGDDQKWHFTVYDCDSAMGFDGGTGSGNHLNSALNVNDTNDGSTKMAPGFLKRCFKNDGFKKRFANRFADLLNTALKPERTTNIIAQAAARIESEIPRTAARWTNMGSYSSWTSELTTFNKFFQNRPGYQWGYLKSKCSSGDYANITLTNCVGAGAVKLNTIESGKHFELPFTGQYFTDIPVMLTATPESGYEFSGWKVGDETVSSELTMTLAPTNGVTIQAVFAKAESNPQQALRIVEIYGSTNTEIDPEGNTGEFVVITNTSDKVVELAGMTLVSQKVKKGVYTPTLTVEMTAGQVPANGSYKLEQTVLWPGDLTRYISNGEILMTITDSTGLEIQQASVTFDGAADGEGASMIADNLENPCGSWHVGPIHDVPPEPEPVEEDIVLEGALTNDVVVTSEANIKVTLNGVTSENHSLTFNGPGTFTIYYPEGTTNSFTMKNNAAALIATNAAGVVITGPGAGEFTSTKKIGEFGVLAAKDLTIAGGTTTVTFDQDKPTTSCIYLLGNYWQTNGTMNVVMPRTNTTNEFNGIQLVNKKTWAKIDGGTFNATVGGTKSNAIKLKGSCFGYFNGGTVTASLIGPQARVTNGGTQDFTGGNYVVTMPEDYASLTNARVFKVDKALTITGGTFDVDVPSAGSEVFATDETMTVSGGTFRLLSGNDCVSAETGFTMTGGTFYGTSTGNDVIDSNADIEISGGLLLAYTTAVEEDGYGSLGLDVNVGHTLTISGGTVVALGGPNSKWPDGCVFNQATYTNVDLDAALYSEKYLVLDGELNKTTVKLPTMSGTFSLLASGAGIAEPTVSDVAPTGTQVAEGVPAWIEPKHNQQFLRFHEIYGNTADGADGDTGEYIVLTNVSSVATVELAGLKVNVEKYDDWVEKGEDGSKCKFTLTSGTLGPGESMTFEQTTYWGGKKQKITNGDLYVALTDADGETVQSGTTSNDFFPECDGNGASLMAKTFGTTLAMTQDDWEPSFRWYYFTSDDTAATITGFGTTKLAETTLTIPRELGKVSVTTIDTNAFAGCALTTLKVTLTNETLKVLGTGGASISTYDMSESEGELVLGYALGSTLDVSGTTVLGTSAATLAFDLGEGVKQEVSGTTSDATKLYNLTAKSGILGFSTKNGSATPFRDRIVTADGSNAVVKVYSKTDTTGYDNPAVKIVAKNGGQFQIGKRDTLVAPVELSDGEVKLLAGCADNDRGLDLFNANGNNWSITGNSIFSVDSNIGSGNGRKVLLRNGNWNIDVAANSLFTVYATLISYNANAGGTRGKIVKTGAGTLYLAATDSDYTTATEIKEGKLKLAKSSLSGALVMSVGTALDLNYAGEVVEGAAVFSAPSISVEGVTFTINGEPLPEGLTLNVENGNLVVGKPKLTTCLNPYAVKDGDALKVSSNTDLTQAGNAYDGDASTYFGPADEANALGNSWTGIEFTNGVIVTRIVYNSRSDRKYRMVGGVFQGANTNDFSDAETIYVVDACPGEAEDVTLEEAKGPYKYLRFIGMYGGNVAEIKYYGLPPNATSDAPASAPTITGESVDGVAEIALTADATIPQVYIVQRAMRNFCDEDGSDYETFVTLAPQLGETVNWTDSKATGYAMYRAKGVNANGSSDWTYFEMEPEKLINGDAAPKFTGNAPGFYTDTTLVTISYGDPNAKIYYTLDGSTPTTNSLLYTEAGITLKDVCSNTNNLCNIPTNPSELWNNNTYGWKQPTADQPDVNVIRARAFTDDGAASTNEIAGTWMIGPTVGDHLTNGLRVVSIITDKANFFDDTVGIMVPGDIYKEKGFGSHMVGKPNANYFQSGIDWERPAFVEMFEGDGREMFSIKMGTRMHGNVSRAIAKKTMQCYARKEYGTKNIKVDKKFKLFADEDHNKFKRIALRNGGNDWQVLNMRDAFGQAIFRGEGIDIKTDTQGYEPVVAYVNGEYWGLYNLRHAYSKQHFEEWNGAAEDDVDHIKMFPAEDGSKFEIQEGDGLAIREIMQYMVTCTSDGMMDDDEFAEVERQVDIDDMIDYYIVRFFLANGDSMNGNNMGMWRSRSGEDQRWHFTIFDCDEALSSSSMDLINYALNRSQDTSDTSNFYEPCFFKRCFKNAGFKQRFANRYADLLNTALKVERTTNLFAQATAKVRPEMERTVARWLNMTSVATWESNQTTVRNFFINRPGSEFSHIKSHCSTGDYANITLTNCVGKGAVKLNTIESGKHFELPFTGQYFTDIPVTLTATPEKGNQFEGWKIGDEIVSTATTMTLTPTNGVTVQAVFAESEGNPQQALRIVEIYGSTNKQIDPEKNTDEYVVITNATDKAIDLAGLRLTSAKVGKDPSVNVTLMGGTIEANGSYKFKQSDWPTSEWEKITNGSICMTLIDSDGAEIQVANTEFTGNADGEGASMIADNLDNPCNAWHVGPIHDVPPEPEPVKELVFTGDYPTGATVAMTNDTTVIVSNATFGAALTFTSNFVATIQVPEDTASTLPKITTAGAIVLEGEGTLSLSNNATLIECGGITIDGATLNLDIFGPMDDTMVAAEMKGSYLQKGGVVNMNLSCTNTFNKKGVLREKSLYGFRWKDQTNCTATVKKSGVFNATMHNDCNSVVFKANHESNAVEFDEAILTGSFTGVDGRFVDTKGTLTIKGGSDIDVTNASTGASIFKADGKIALKKLTAKVNATGAGSKVFSSEDSIEAGHDNLILYLVSQDKCFNAETNITFTKGVVYCQAVSGNAFSTNATLKVTGGTIVALGGADSIWPNVCDFQQDVYTNNACAAEDWSEKYLVAKGSTELADVTATVQMPTLVNPFSMLVTTAGLAGDPTASEDDPTIDPIAEDVPVWIATANKTFQEYLRYIDIYGSTTGKKGDVGEWFVLTNVCDKTVVLTGLNIELTKTGDTESKCKFSVTNDTSIAPHEFLKFNQADWTAAGWVKITNGDIYYKLSNNAGTIQEGNLEFCAAADGLGASMVTTNLATTLTYADWEPSFKIPSTNTTGNAGIDLGTTDPEKAEAKAKGYDVVLTDEDKAAGVEKNMLKMTAVPVTDEAGEVTGYNAVIAVNPEVVEEPEVGSGTSAEEEEVKPIVITPDGEGNTSVSVGIVNAAQGLWYGYEVSEALGTQDFTNDVESFKRATGAAISIEGSKRSGSAAFFRVKVLPAKPTE